MLFQRLGTAIFGYTVEKQIRIRQFPVGTGLVMTWNACWVPVLLVAVAAIGAPPQTALASSPLSSPASALVNQYCAECHDSEMKKGGLDLDSLRLEDVTKHSEVWEKVVRKLRARQMPPMGKARPEERAYEKVVARLSDALDSAAAKHPNPGRTETFRRLNRTEYQNVIRDLLALEIDATELLPKDDASQGFDNVTVGNLSPTLLDRYITAAQKIGRLAVGAPRRSPAGDTFPPVGGNVAISAAMSRTAADPTTTAAMAPPTCILEIIGVVLLKALARPLRFLASWPDARETSRTP